MGNNNSYQNNYNYNMDVTSINDDETLDEIYTNMYMANEYHKFLQKNGEWIHLPALKTALVRHSPSWDVRNYGVSQSKGLVGLLELPGISEIFEVKVFGRSSARVRSKQ